MTETIRRIKEDLKRFWLAFLASAGYLIGMQLVFHQTCLLVFFTGLPCPTCGMTRAFGLLLHGKFTDAFRMQPFVYIVIILIGCFCYLRYIKKKSVRILLVPTLLFILGCIIYYIYGMVQYFPNREPYVLYEEGFLPKLLQLFNGN